MEFFTTRGNKRSQFTFKSTMSQRLLEPQTKLQKDKDFIERSHSETVVNLSPFLLLSFFLCIYQCRDVSYPLCKSWHPSTCEITTRMEQNSNYAYFHSKIFPFIFHCLKHCRSTFIFLFYPLYHLGEISTQPMTNIKSRKTRYISECLNRPALCYYFENACCLR